jgi:rhodanese-related sulfurtransferase
VPGAINIPRGKLEFDIWKLAGYPNVDYKREIYVQCRSGTRATLAARTLRTLGFQNPVIVLMNFGDWEKAGHPVVAPVF